MTLRSAGKDAAPGPPSWKLEAHTDAVRGLCWLQSETHTWLASASLDGTVCIWETTDVASGTAPALHDTLREHSGPVNAVVDVSRGAPQAGGPKVFLTALGIFLPPFIRL